MLMDRTSRLLLLLLAGIAPLGACEPILPMFLVLGGAATLGHSLLVLLLAILCKSAIYAWLLRRQSAAPAFGSMMAGNALSTLVGVFAAAVVSGIPLLGLAGIAICAIMPARRIAAEFPRIHGTLSTFSIVFIMTALVLASMLVWGYSQSVLKEHGSMTLYWSAKIGFVFVGLLCGLFITIFWEEWVIWRMSPGTNAGPHHFNSIVAANVITLGLVAIYAAMIVLPRRLESPNFLVELLNRLLTSA